MHKVKKKTKTKETLLLKSLIKKQYFKDNPVSGTQYFYMFQQHHSSFPQLPFLVRL